MKKEEEQKRKIWRKMIKIQEAVNATPILPQSTPL